MKWILAEFFLKSSNSMYFFVCTNVQWSFLLFHMYVYISLCVYKDKDNDDDDDNNICPLYYFAYYCKTVFVNFLFFFWCCPMTNKGPCSISFLFFLTKNKLNSHLPFHPCDIHIDHFFFFLNIFHSSFHTSEKKCICLLYYYYRVLVQCTFFLFFVYEEQSCYSLVVIILPMHHHTYFIVKKKTNNRYKTHCA